ncbi:PAS domain-containing protein [Variovorax boronicumulans]|uniref:PAS domain-containing protein n=1 Tax=Variovorax boronicumulans TaxID=436515 RepID=UPI001C56DE81
MSRQRSSAFASGGGEMGARMRAFDWSATPIGPIAAWPAALRISVDSMLSSDFPACLFWGPDLIALYNDGYRKLLGNKPDALGQPFRVTWQEVWETLRPIAEKALQGESTFIEDFPIHIDRYGVLEEAFFTFCYSPQYDAHGDILGVLDTVVETTGKVLAERGLRHERERQQNLLQQMPGFVAVLSGPTHVFTYVNDAYVQIAGPRDFIGRTVREVFPELDGQDIYERLDRVFSTGQPVHAKALPLLLEGDREARYIDLLYEAIRDDNGQTTGIFVGGYDITEHERAKSDLAASETRLRELAASLEQQVEERTRALQDSEDFTRLALGATGGVGVWSYRVASDTFFCDAAISELYGLDPKVAAKGIPRTAFLANVHPDDLPRLRETMSGGLRNEGALELEYRIRHPDGSVRSVLSRGHTYFDDAGQAVRRTGVGIDMTGQRQLEEQLRQSQKMEALGLLTGGIAHDFNNMLQGIVMPLQLMRKRLEQRRYEGLERYIEAGLDSARRAASITQRLLAFSRRQPLANRSLEIATALRGLEEILRNAVGENVAVVFDEQEGTWDVLTDPHQFDSALLNLTINARDAMPVGGTLSIQVRNLSLSASEASRIQGLMAGDYVRVSVADTGIGMSAAVITQAFEPFFTTKPMGQGTGLGLSMIYGYTRQSKGSITIESAEGTGTTVSLFLPRAPLAAAPEDALAPPAPGAGPTRRRILVVEDDAVVRQIAVELLRDQGYEVLEAADGTAGMAWLEQAPHIDLLLSDVGLPGPNGRQLADFALTRRPGIRVILMTGYAAHVATDAALLQGNVELMTKPFDADALLHKVNRMLGAQDDA